MFKFSHAVSMAYRSLKSSKLRTALTALGIIIGIASVVSIATVGTSFQTYFESQILDSGSDYIQIMAKDENLLHKSELEVVRNTRGVVDVTPMCFTTANVTFMGETKQLIVTGVDENFKDIIKVNMLEGSFIRKTDTGSVVISEDMHDETFENDLNVRNVIRIDLYNKYTKSEHPYNFKVKGIEGLEEGDKSIVSGVMTFSGLTIPLSE
ncbi:MAG: ABC transporter permease [Methanosarcinaceae archaeon]|nr:ABC transporter permease [Methanosarcinaceae archaeon]